MSSKDKPWTLQRILSRVSWKSAGESKVLQVSWPEDLSVFNAIRTHCFPGSSPATLWKRPRKSRPEVQDDSKASKLVHELSGLVLGQKGCEERHTCRKTWSARRLAGQGAQERAHGWDTWESSTRDWARVMQLGKTLPEKHMEETGPSPHPLPCPPSSFSIFCVSLALCRRTSGYKEFWGRNNN